MNYSEEIGYNGANPPKGTTIEVMNREKSYDEGVTWHTDTWVCPMSTADRYDGEKTHDGPSESYAGVFSSGRWFTHCSVWNGQRWVSRRYLS